MKILVTGVKGQLGYDCVKELTKRGYTDILGIDIENLDITNETKVLDFITNYKPNVVMHNAAYTAVDKAELNYDDCYKVNVLGTKYIAEACKNTNAKMIYISTDYVFDGTKDGLYEVNDKTNPISVYGKTKLEGELVVKSLIDKYFIVRISWVFGINGNNFLFLTLSSTEKTTKTTQYNDGQFKSRSSYFNYRWYPWGNYLY